jgi:outer membrane receptor protein involved in Fe transport
MNASRTAISDRLLTALLALGLALTPMVRAQVAPAVQPEVVTLSPFVVSTDKDKGYLATNVISGSRVNTPIKDLPIPIDVITSEFISDIGATDLRSALAYSAGIMLMTQNDLENTTTTYGSPYGLGGVNNPQGLTTNINQVQLKLRGFVTNNTLRDGFLRGNSTEAVNIDRIEVVSGPNALLYGTGNFGGVVDYLTQQPRNEEQGDVSFSYGTYDFMRTALDVTGPISSANHLDYRVAGAWESSDTNIKYQSNSHYFIAPSLSWNPTPTTSILIDTEYGKSMQNGYGFQALRAAQGTSGTPINNDQLEAVAFYFPPGADHRTVNLSGPDTFNDQQESNIEIKATQEILRETRFLPEVNFLIGYNHASWAAQTQSVNGEITGPILPGNPGYNLSQTIYTYGATNGIGGQSVSNLSLLFGAFPNSVTEYGWNQANQQTTRDQERVEITARKSLFEGKWYHLEDQFLGGFSALCNEVTKNNWQTAPNLYSYKSPNDLTPIRFGTQGDGTADPAMYENDLNNIDKVWDAGYYFNNYAKLFKFLGADDRVILMNGFRHDKIDSWSTDTTISAPGSAPSTAVGRALTVVQDSYQNGVMIKITKNLSIYGLKSEGLQPNFGGLHNSVTGAPVGADTGKSRELGIKFDFFDGKISGTISKYTITKTAWEGQPWYVPALMGHVYFNPNKPIVYELSGGFNALFAPDPRLPGVSPSGQGGSAQVDPTVTAAWNAALNAGAITHLSPITGQALSPNSIYINCSTAAGAAYMNAVFAATQNSTWNGAWPGWLYNGAGSDPNTNNATWDATGFSGKGSAAWQVIDQSKGYDGQIFFTPNDHLQIVFTGSIDATVRRLNLGQWPQYPYPQDKWAVWYFPNGSWGLMNEPLNVAYADPSNTATRTNVGAYPGDDTPRYACSLWMNYKFGGQLKGVSVGVGGTWHSQEEFFSGVTHGSGQVEINTAGQPIVAYSPSQVLINLFAKYEWKRWGHNQFVQLNVDNVLDDQKLYGLIYSTPLTARISYGIKF